MQERLDYFKDQYKKFSIYNAIKSESDLRRYILNVASRKAKMKIIKILINSNKMHLLKAVKIDYKTLVKLANTRYLPPAGREYYTDILSLKNKFKIEPDLRKLVLVRNIS